MEGLKQTLLVFLAIGVLMLFGSWISTIGTKELDYMPRAVLGTWRSEFDDWLTEVRVKKGSVELITDEGQVLRCIPKDVFTRNEIFGDTRTTSIYCDLAQGSAVAFWKECGRKPLYWLVKFEQDVSEDFGVNIQSTVDVSCGHGGRWYKWEDAGGWFDRVS